jgi:hypothetical protein
MAKYLSNIDLSNNELQNAVIHPLGTAPSGPSEGQVYYNTGQDKVYVYNGTAWISIAGDITEVQSATTGQLTVSNGTGPIPSLSIVTGAVTNGGSALATGDQIYDFVLGLGYTGNAGDITRVNITAGAGLTGTVDTTSGDHTQTINVVGGDGITANADEIEVAVDNTTIELSASTGSGVVRAKTATIVDGGTGLATADQIHTFVTGYADPAGTDNSTDVTLAGSLDYITISGQVITRNAIDLTTDVTGALPIGNGGTGQTTAAAAANALLNTSQGGSLTIGDGSDEIVIPGDLTVTGTTTTNNVEVVSTSNGVIFEGNAADANELTLLAGTLTADRTVTLPDATGTVALTSDLHDAVTVTGSYDYITLSGQQITVGQVDYNTDIANTPTIPTVNNGTLTVQGTGALGGSGTFTANQSGNTTISISHDDTSTQASVNNSGLTVIQDVTLDTYGHTTGLASVDLTSGVDGRITAREFAVDLDAAEGSVTKSTNTYTVTHGLASRDVMIEIYDTSTYDTVYADVARPTTGTVTVAFAQSVTDGDYRVMIKKIG